MILLHGNTQSVRIIDQGEARLRKKANENANLSLADQRLGMIVRAPMLHAERLRQCVDVLAVPIFELDFRRPVYKLVYMDRERQAMNIEVGSYEAKTKLPELLRGIQAGNRYTITLRGEAVADLVPAETSNNVDAATAADEMLSFMRARKSLPDIDLETLIDEGRA
jgi:antitoxin (DNA-binding transcriptional repressor) of toxin-antitoxin stability system